MAEAKEPMLTLAAENLTALRLAAIGAISALKRSPCADAAPTVEALQEGLRRTGEDFVVEVE